MNDNTHRTFLLAATVVVVLLLMHLLPHMAVGDVALRPVSVLADIADDALRAPDRDLQLPDGGSASAAQASDAAPTALADTLAQWPDSVAPIADYSGGAAGGMAHYYAVADSLARHLSTGRPLRIAYYGDSFIEGDLLVADLRELLQRHYGGCGVGWLDAGNELNAYRMSASVKMNRLKGHNVMQRDSYRPEMAGISERYSDAGAGSSLSVAATNAYPHAGKWDVARMYLRTPRGAVVGVSAGDGPVRKLDVQPSDKVQQIELRQTTTRTTFQVVAGQPTLYGLSLEGNGGVVVDNFSMRGSSGIGLANIPASTLDDFWHLRPYDLVILQYGVNAVTPSSTKESTEWYIKSMRKVIAHLREHYPQASILVVSTPDRGWRRAGQLGTMPGIPLLVSYQQRLAKESRVAFYNLYEAMGGEGSMARMCEQGMGSKDFIHINRSGGSHLAGIIYQSLHAGQRLYRAPRPDGKAGVEAQTGKDTIASHSGSQTIGKGWTSILGYNPAEPMIFSSGLFMFLFLGFTFVYFLLRKKVEARLVFVTLFSYYFYYKSSGLYFILLAAVTLSDFLLATRIYRLRHNQRARKWLLVLSIAIDIGLLAYFKYTNFFAGMVAQMLGHNFQPWDIFLPVGISFFTFQSMSYTIDVYRGKLKPLSRLLDYAFYVSFFPQLVAGPIVRATDFVPQIRQKLRISPAMFARGVLFVAMGLVKKAVVSDYISLNFVDRVFENPQLFTGGEVLLGLYGYSIQIYCDFSGYSDMAIGIALLLGFRFPKNFDAPYKASSVSDFWRRWHISLSSWIRDYVYISLGGNRRGRVRMYFNQMASMMLCGLWHGASLNFVVWGAMHGLLVCLHKMFSQSVLGHDRHYRSRGWKRVVAVVLTFNVVSLMWVFFRNEDAAAAQMMLVQMCTKFDLGLLWQAVVAYKYVFALIALAFAAHFMPSRWQQPMVRVLEKSGVVGCALLLVAVVYVVIQVKTADVQPFIYFQF